MTWCYIPPQHIKAYLRGQKNDFNDAQALVEAALVGRIRPVLVKTVSQQDEQVLLRTRQQLVSERTRRSISSEPYWLSMAL